MLATKKKNILITGATGYLGSRLCIELVEKYKIIAIKRPNSNLSNLEKINDKIIYYDYDDRNSLEKIFHEHTIDIIIHTATSYNTELKHAILNENANVILPLSLLELAYRENPATCFLNIGSILEPSISIYALSKKHFSQWLSVFSEHLLCIDVSLSQFYGPMESETKFCAYVINKLLRSEKNIDLTLGEQKRDFIYIDDVVNAIVFLLGHHQNTKSGYYHYPIGTGTNTSLKDFTLLTKDLIGNITTELNFGAQNYRKNEVFEYSLNLEPLFSLGWRPQFDLRTGLRETIRKQALCQGRGLAA